MINAVAPRSVAIVRAFSPPRAEAPQPTPSDHVTLGKSLGLNVVGVASKGALLASTALAGWKGGAAGMIGSIVGGGIGYGVYSASIGDTDLKSMGQAATAGCLVGILGGAAGKLFGLDGVILMGALGATGSVIARVMRWAEG